jgi:hypothetical protein
LTPDELIAAIEASRPPHYFDGARSLLEAYADVMSELDRLQGEMRPMRSGTSEFSELLEVFATRTAEAAELFETLHLGPHNRGLPPPRLQ